VSGRRIFLSNEESKQVTKRKPNKGGYTLGHDHDQERADDFKTRLLLLMASTRSNKILWDLPFWPRPGVQVENNEMGVLPV
jgi:hypothetical protein